MVRSYGFSSTGSHQKWVRVDISHFRKKKSIKMGSPTIFVFMVVLGGNYGSGDHDMAGV